MEKLKIAGGDGLGGRVDISGGKNSGVGVIGGRIVGDCGVRIEGVGDI